MQWALQSCSVSRAQFLWLSVAGKRRVKGPPARGLSEGCHQQCAGDSACSQWSTCRFRFV